MTYSSHSNPDLKHYSKVNSTVVCRFHLIDPLYSLDFEVLRSQSGIVYLQEDAGVAQSGSTDLRTGQQQKNWLVHGTLKRKTITHCQAYHNDYIICF